jgi:hypothetical protein
MAYRASTRRSRATESAPARALTRAGEQFPHPGSVAHGGDEAALALVAAQRDERVALRLGLDPGPDRRHPQGVSERDHGSDDPEVMFIVDLRNQTAIDLQAPEWKAVQDRER